MQSNVKQLEEARGREKLAHVNSFIQRNYGLWVAISFGIYPLAAIFSAITEGSRIYLSVYEVVPSSAMAMVATGILVLLIEVVMFFTGKTAVDDVQAGVFSLGGAHVAAFALKLIIFIGVTGFSISLSLSGAHDSSISMAAKNKPPMLASMDSLNQVYDKRLLPYQQNMEAARSTRWKGSVTRDAMKNLTATQSTVDRIESERAAAADSLTAYNARITQAWSDKTATSANWLKGFAGIGEALKIFCLIFIGIYDQGVIKEAHGSGKSGSSSTSGSGSRSPGFFPSSAPPVIAEHDEGPRMGASFPHPDSLLGRLYGSGPATAPPPPQPQTSGDSIPPVATGSYSVATDNDEGDDKQQIDITGRALLRARANAVSNYKAWKSKPGGTEVTRKKNLDRLEQEIAELDERLAKYCITFNDDYRA